MMLELLWFDVPVEYGPSAADVTHYYVKALDEDDAAKQAVELYHYDFPYGKQGMASRAAVEVMSYEEIVKHTDSKNFRRKTPFSTIIGECLQDLAAVTTMSIQGLEWEHRETLELLYTRAILDRQTDGLSFYRWVAQRVKLKLEAYQQHLTSTNECGIL
jgi:hypothetical protein